MGFQRGFMILEIQLIDVEKENAELPNPQTIFPSEELRQQKVKGQSRDHGKNSVSSAASSVWPAALSVLLISFTVAFKGDHKRAFTFLFYVCMIFELCHFI